MADEISIETTSQEVIEVGVPGPQGPAGAGAAGASTWNDITGKPSTFAPSAHASSHAIGGSDPITPANIGAAKEVGTIELTPNGTTTITTSQLPARGIAFIDGGANFTVNLPTPGLRKSGLWFSIKTEHEGGVGEVFITVVHNAVNLLTTFDLTQDEGSIDFLWDGYEWTYSSKYYIASSPTRELLLPNASGIIARTSDIPSTFAASAITSGVLNNARVNFAAPPAIGSTTPNTVAATDLSASNKLSLPSAAALSPTAGDLYRNANTLRYRDSTNTERLLLNATDNLSNLANTATARANLGLGTAATANLDALSDSAFRIADNGDATKKLAFELSGISTATTRTLTVPNASGTIALTSDIATDFSDSAFRVSDNTDATKKLAFELSGISTATTRTLTVPNASGTIALTNGSTNLWIAASSFIPRTTNGCGVDSRETSTNRTNWDELLFDAGADEFAQAVVVMPSNYNNGTITARFYWTASTAGDGTDDVIWGIQGRAFADDAALDAAFGSAVTVTDTLLATNDMHVTSATSAATIDGSPAANRPILFQIYRDADAAGDTYSADARLLGVEIIYTAA